MLTYVMIRIVKRIIDGKTSQIVAVDMTSPNWQKVNHLSAQAQLEK